jgi:hypothetical protein
MENIKSTNHSDQLPEPYISAKNYIAASDNYRSANT